MSDDVDPALSVTHVRPEMSRGRKVGWFLIGMLLTAFLVSYVYASIQSAVTVHAVRDTQVTNTKVSRNTQAILKTIKSCTTPGQECYERSLRQQGSVVAALNKYVVLASSCTARLTLRGLPPDISQKDLTAMITDCVVTELRSGR